MAHKMGITGSMEAPSRHFPQWQPWQIALFALAILSVIGGSIVLGLSQTTWKSPTLPSLPVQGGIPPTAVPTSTPTIAPTSRPELSLKWETNGPAESAGIMAVVVNDSESKVIYAVGGVPEDFYPRYVWKSGDGGLSWKSLGLITNEEVSFKGKEEIYKTFNLSPTLSLTWEEKRDPNNVNAILKPTLLPVPPLTEPEWEFRLSLDGGKSWTRINLPPSWEYKGNMILGEKHHFDLVSSNGTLKIFLAAGSKIWHTTISLP